MHLEIMSIHLIKQLLENSFALTIAEKCSFPLYLSFLSIPTCKEMINIKVIYVNHILCLNIKEHQAINGMINNKDYFLCLIKIIQSI